MIFTRKYHKRVKKGENKIKKENNYEYRLIKN